MNMSRVISHLISSLGLYNIGSLFKDENTGEPMTTENVVRNIIVTSTIPQYSEFKPWIREYQCDIAKLKCVNQHQFIYMLPEFLTMTEVRYIIDVSLPNVNTRGTYGDVAPAYGINRSVQGVATSQAYMMVAGQMRAEPTFEDMGDNKVKLYGFPKCELVFKVAANHSPNGETIPESCWDSFVQLATLDVKMSLYNTLKYYNNIPTAFGNLELKIDEWSGAEAERNELLNQWRDVYHVDMVDWFEWM